MQGRIDAVDKVYIRKGAKFVGDIHCVGIVIEDGAYIKAGIECLGQADKSRAALDRFKQLQ